MLKATTRGSHPEFPARKDDVRRWYSAPV